MTDTNVIKLAQPGTFNDSLTEQVPTLQRSMRFNRTSHLESEARSGHRET